MLAASALVASPSRADETLTFGLDQGEIALPAGYSRVEVAVRPGAMATIAVFGPRESLLHFAIDGVVAPDPLSEDGMLPRVASFFVPEGVTHVSLSLEVDDEAFVERVMADPGASMPKLDEPPLLIGLPSPSRREDGYVLERPGRYQFARPDVAWSLIEAFRDVRRRFRRDPIGITDISQWDARRPALDIGQPRHVSHEGGRDVDIGLPSTQEPSLLRDHCDKEIAPDFHKAWCKKGTSRDLDASRLAFLLGRLVKTGAVDKIFLDQEFIPAVADAAKKLVNPKSYPGQVAEKLQPEAGVLKHLPWHTDHVHVRFLGVKGNRPFER